MHWGKFALAVFCGGAVSSMTDWLFMGDFVYKRFDKHPEIWRVSGGKNETSAIAWSSVLPFFTCAVFELICIRQHAVSWAPAMTLAIAIWLAVALPLLIANAIWIKVSAPITASHSAGWLVKLLIAAASAVLIAS